MNNSLSHILSGRRWLMLAGVVTIAAVAAIAGSALSPASSSNGANGAHNTVGPVAAIPAELASNLAVLRRTASGADELPSRLKKDFSVLFPSADPNAVGANLALAREALIAPESVGTGTPQDVTAYLIPTTTGACVTDTNLSEHFCSSTAEILNGQAAASVECSPSLPPGEIEIAGILPDAASDPVVNLSNGSSQDLPVEGNVYLERFARSGPLPRTISWGAAGERKTTSADVPPEVSTERCGTPKNLPAEVASGKIPGHPPANPTVKVEYNNG